MCNDLPSHVGKVCTRGFSSLLPAARQPERATPRLTRLRLSGFDGQVPGAMCLCRGFGETGAMEPACGMQAKAMRGRIPLWCFSLGLAAA
jgi:hypothetical protein